MRLQLATHAAEFRIRGVRQQECRIFAGNTDGAYTDIEKLRDQSFVRRSRQNHPHQLEIFRARYSPPAAKCRFDAKSTLQGRYLIPAAVHNHQRLAAIGGAAELDDQLRIALCTPADLHDAPHAGSPSASSRPSIRLAFCTA